MVISLAKQCSMGGEFSPYIFTPDLHSRTEIIINKKYYTQIKLKHHAPPPINRKVEFKGVLAFLVYFPFEIFKFLWIIKKFDIKVINFHYVGGLAPLHFAIMKLILKIDINLILSFHGSDILTIESITGIRKKILGFMLSATDHTIGCSKGLSNQIKDLFPSDFNNTVCINNGISELFLSDESSSSFKERLPEELCNKKFILSVGAFIKVKGHDLLIKAFSQVHKIDPELSLVIIGKSAPESENCKQLINFSHLEPVTFIYDQVSPELLKVFYDHAQIFVSASRYESFGLVMAEAGARKLPVIATRTLGAEEIIEDGVSGILVEQGNHEAITEAINILLDDPQRGVFLAENLKQKVTSNFRWKYAWEKYRRLIDDNSSIF